LLGQNEEAKLKRKNSFDEAVDIKKDGFGSIMEQVQAMDTKKRVAPRKGNKTTMMRPKLNSTRLVTECFGLQHDVVSYHKLTSQTYGGILEQREKQK